MASGAAWIGPVLLHPLPQSPGQLLVFLSSGTSGGGGGGVCLTDFQYPFPTLYRRGARRVRSYRENAGLGQNAAALIAC